MRGIGKVNTCKQLGCERRPVSVRARLGKGASRCWRQEDVLNKADLISRIARASRITRSQATNAVEAMIGSVTAALKKGERVTLSGFGTLAVAERKAKAVRNPQTGATIKIEARKVAKFTSGIELKKAINRN